MRSLVVVLSALVFFAIAALHVYRVYAGIPVIVGGHAIPMAWSLYAVGVTATLALLLLVFARK